MKKGICIILVFTIIFLSIYNASGNNVANAEQKSIENKIIRFHVIANSDTIQDQAIKLKVRDAVLKYIYPKMNNSKDINDSRSVLHNYDDEIKNISEKVLKDNGFSYSVQTVLDHENFPIKTYGNITLPQGQYEAYKIVLGSGKGHNWWCVMFPPLCFVDITRGEISNKQTEAEMKKVLTNDEYEMVNNDSKDQEKIVIKFKFVEIFNDMKSKINRLLLQQTKTR
jgi:stage II sporulation protein R